MKIKNGFTLIELLATIALLGLLAIVIYPNVTEQIEKKQKEVDQTKLELIYSGAKDYILENQNENKYYLNVGDNYCVDLETLERNNYISIEIDDIKKEYTHVGVKIGKDNNYSYNLIKKNSDCKDIK